MSGKLFPRNLTARAAYQVEGNPISSRPESGVDNTHPGLELDPRNLDRVFFPGLAFDFVFRVGARLTQVHPAELAQAADILPADLATAPLFLWGCHGHFGGAPTALVRFDAYGQDGYQVMRQIRDLEVDSPLFVVLGPARPAADDARGAAWDAQFAQVMSQATSRSASHVERVNGVLQWAVLLGQRARFLDEHGVIDPLVAELEPGFLTQSLCSPWQWDFADCGCYYWAASRPDIVTDASGTQNTLNYQRDAATTTPPAVPLGNWTTWMEGTITLPQMMKRWRTLPIVVDDREQPSGVVPAARAWPTSPEPLWTLPEITAQLTHLATVEHALSVQYLYAMYSLNLGPTSLDGQIKIPPAAQADLALCASEIRAIAVDEMRHLQWVNEALALLGQPPSLGRADVFSRLPPGSRLKHVDARFELAPLTDATLLKFMGVEQASRLSQDMDTPTGLYVHILISVNALADSAFPGGARTRDRIMGLLKLLIDEGDEHAQRLALVRLRLPADDRVRLRVRKGPEPAPAGTDLAVWQAQGDQLYALLLNELAQAYAQATPPQQARLPGDAGTPMRALSGVAKQLAEKGAGLLFTLPAAP